MANSKIDVNYMQNCVYARKADIKKIITELENLSADFLNYAKNIRESGENCNENVLSVCGKTLKDDFDEIANKAENYANNMLEYANSLKANYEAVASSQYKRIQDSIEKAKEQSVSVSSGGYRKVGPSVVDNLKINNKVSITNKPITMK